MLSTKVSALFAKLDACSEAGALPLDVLKRELENLRVTLDDFAGHISYKNDCYQRNRLHIGPNYHALALCWGPGQHSVIHDHEHCGCGFLVVSGTAIETRYVRDDNGLLKKLDAKHHKPGTVRVSFDADIHRMGNDDPKEGLVTLHIYSPPLLEANTYEEGSSETGRWEDPIIHKLARAGR